MLSPDVKDAPPAKKAKLEELALYPRIEKYEEYRELPGMEYFVGVALENLTKHHESGEDMMSLYRQVMRDAGCPELKLSPIYFSYHFYAKLTPDEVERLSALDSVYIVSPSKNWRVYHEFNQPAASGDGYITSVDSLFEPSSSDRS